MKFVHEDLVLSITSIRNLISGINITQFHVFRELPCKNASTRLLNPTSNSCGELESKVSVGDNKQSKDVSGNTIKGKVGVSQKPRTLIEELTSALGCRSIESSKSTEPSELELIQKCNNPTVTFKLKAKRREACKGLRLKTKRKLHEIDHTTVASLEESKESAKLNKHRSSKEYKVYCPYCKKKIRGDNFDKHIAICFQEEEVKGKVGLKRGRRVAARTARYTAKANTKRVFN